MSQYAAVRLRIALRHGTAIRRYARATRRAVGAYVAIRYLYLDRRGNNTAACAHDTDSERYDTTGHDTASVRATTRRCAQRLGAVCA